MHALRRSCVAIALAFLSTLPGYGQNTFAANGVSQPGTLPPSGSVSYTFSAQATSFWYGTFSQLPSGMTIRTVVTRVSDGRMLQSNGSQYWQGGGQAAAADSYTVTLTRTDTSKAQGKFTITNAIVPGPPTPQADEEGGLLVDEITKSGSVAFGDVDVYWFNANASDPGLNVEIEGSASASLTLIAPNGKLSDNCGRPGCYFYNNLPGRIYALVTPTSAAAASYTLTLHNSTASVPGQLGKSLGAKCAPCQASLESAGSTGTVAVGDPINISSGNVFETVVDYTTAGPNPLAMVRYYNSAASQQSSPFAVSLGTNWRTSFDRYLHLVSPAVVTAERPDGRILTFRYANFAWATDTDIDMRLANTGSTWTLIDHDDVRETYVAVSSTEAQLSTIATAAGYTQTMAYSGTQLSGVSDSYGRRLGFTYTGTVLTGVTTPDTLQLAYGFDIAGGSNRLISVSYNTSPTTSQTYLYENEAFPFALTGVTDENGARFSTWGYDSQGRGISSQLAGGADATSVSYAADGMSAVVTGPLGLQETYKFKTLQDVSKIIEIDRHDPSGSVPDAAETLTYDSNGYLASRTDWNGNRTTFTNNANGDTTAIVEAYGSTASAVSRTTRITYDPTWPRKRKTIALGNTTIANLFDAATGNLTQKTQTDGTNMSGAYAPAAHVWRYSYTPTGQLLTAQSPRTDLTSSTTYGYTGGILTSITNPLNQATTISAYTPGGRPTTVTDRNGVLSTLTYSSRNWLLTSSVATAGGPRTTVHSYDAAGNLTSVQQPGGATLTTGYDAAHRPTSVTDLFGNTIDYTLDARGDTIATTIKDASATTQLSRSDTYDALGRKLTHTGGAKQVTRYVYDPNGNIISITDPLGHPAVVKTFDALNRLIKVTDRAAGITQYGWDANDNLLIVTAPNNATTTYVYNGLENRVKVASPDSGSSVFYYDGDNNLTKKQDALNIVAIYTYDALDRRTGATYPASPSENITYGYDQSGHGFAVGRLTSMTDQEGKFSRSYDERGNITSEGHTHGIYTLTNGYGYNAGGKLISQTYPDGTVLTQARDAMERITGLTLQPSSGSASQTVLRGISYKPFGSVAGFTNGNGIADNRTYDGDYRLTNVTDAGKATLQNLTYVLNANDNVAGIMDAVTSSNSQKLTYDALDRMLTAAGGYGSESFGYDVNGNRTSLNGVANAYMPNSNRLTKIGTQAVATNANGNITAIAYPAPMGFTYNNANRLATVTSSGSTLLSYVYDGFGQRVGKTDTSQSFEDYDQLGRLAEQTDNSSKAQRDYIYLEGLPVATFVTNGAAGTLAFLHTDRLGTPRLATNAGQSIGWSMTTADPFGAPSGGTTNTIANDLRMPGQEFEFATAHNHNGRRDYAPALGRYLEIDPTGLAGGLNDYAYAGNNPGKFVDLTGEDFRTTALVICSWLMICANDGGPFTSNQSLGQDAVQFSQQLDPNNGFKDFSEAQKVLNSPCPLEDYQTDVSDSPSFFGRLFSLILGFLDEGSVLIDPVFTGPILQTSSNGPA